METTSLTSLTQNIGIKTNTISTTISNKTPQPPYCYYYYYGVLSCTNLIFIINQNMISVQISIEQRQGTLN